MTPFTDPSLAQFFANVPVAMRRKLMALRELIFRTAAVTPGVGPLLETRKWGEPAYLTAQTKSGSTVRLGYKPSKPDQCAVYFVCHTHLIDSFRTRFPLELRFEANRAIVFTIADEIPVDTLAFCLAAAMTYHLERRGSGSDTKKDRQRVG
jgi:hypothetical protein